MNTSFFCDGELDALGLGSYGRGLKLSRKASLYSPEFMHFGDNVRVDDFCVLSGKIHLGSHIHISVGVALYGGAGIRVEDFATISGRVFIYSVSDDYSGMALTNATIPDAFKSVTEAPVEVRRHAIIGAGSIVLPGVTLEEGVSIGAMSLVRESMPAWSICVGVPARVVKPRKRALLELEQSYLEVWSQTMPEKSVR